VGLLDTLDTLDLSDEVKEQIRREHESEISGSQSTISTLRAQTKKAKVHQEVEDLKQLFGDEPGLLKYVRRVFLSDDEEAGLVLLTDSDMELSDDDKTGATSREEVTAAGVLRQFIELLPKKDGKLALSDQVLLSENTERPSNGDDPTPEEKSAGAKERLGAITGVTVERTRKRYAGGLHVAGGNS